MGKAKHRRRNPNFGTDNAVWSAEELRRQISMSIIQRYELPLAAMAWRLYQKSDRGYLYIPFRNNQKLVKPEEIVYFERGGELWNAAALNAETYGNKNDELHGFVEQYEPQKQFVVLIGFFEENQREHYFKYTPRLSPPQASAAIGQQS